MGWTGEIHLSRTRKHASKNLATSLAAVPPESYSVFAHASSEAGARMRTSGHIDGIVLTSEDLHAQEKELAEDAKGKIVPVWLYDIDQEGKQEIAFLDQARWRRYAEHNLYTLFHYRPNDNITSQDQRKMWMDYCRLNQKFADKISEIYKPGDVVWIHDYHLMLVPGMLRQKHPDIFIGFFLHIPFPSSELFKGLSYRKELLTGILGSNMVGFQNYSYSRHFASCCSRILRYDAKSAGISAFGAYIAMDVFPIGIDAIGMNKAAHEDENVEQLVHRVRTLYQDCKIIVGRDRLDSVRGVAQKLQAYEKFLERYPQWQNKVVLVQVTSPTSIEEEKEDAGSKIAHKVSELVNRINGEFGGLEYSPVHHYPQYLSPDEYFALLKVADVGLITSVRDGMNTTSLEYIICQKENHGSLIISEFSGTASFLTDAISINPWDFVGVADSIHTALSMSDEERAIQHRKLYKHVVTNTVQEWTKTYLDRLLLNVASFNQTLGTPVLDRGAMLDCYKKAKRRLFMFDYDGTLTPIVQDPQAAVPSDRIVRTIKTLAQDPRNNVWIISGRDQAFLDEWMGHITELGLSAEHGSYIRHPGSEEWVDLTVSMDKSWQPEVIKIFSHFTERTQGSFIERKKVAITWHFRRSDPEYGEFQAEECKKVLETTVGINYDVEVMNGKANLEVRPRFVNKGEIAKRLIEEYGGGDDKEPDFVFCTGDDFTDEDMFRSLRESTLPKEQVFTVTVGASSKQTLAYWHLLEPRDVIATIALCNSSTNNADVGPTTGFD